MRREVARLALEKLIQDGRIHPARIEEMVAKAQREVTNMTNELLRKNAETLKMESIATAKESERGIVDIETLRISNESLISTFDEVLRIQTEGRQKRKEVEVELEKLENDLKNKMLEIRR